MDRNVNIITDLDGRKIVLINDIRFRSRRGIDWKKVEEEIAFKGRSKWVCRVCQFKCVSYFQNPTS